MNLILFLLIGLLAGWLAGKIMKGSGFGLLGNLIVGVIGSFLGGLLFGLLGLASGSLIGSLVTAVVGAMLLLFILSKIRPGGARLAPLALLPLLAAGSAEAESLGIRGGLTQDPDQFHFGGHFNAGEAFSDVYFVPNLEVGLGDNMTLLAFQGDLLLDLNVGPGSSWLPYVGGGLGIYYWDRDAGPGDDASDTEIGLNAVGGLKKGLSSGNQFLLELRLGLVDAPDLKVTAGLNFF